jgi:hypothetical protein
MQAFIWTAPSRWEFEPQIRTAVDEAIRKVDSLALSYWKSNGFGNQATQVFICKSVGALRVPRHLYNIVLAIIGLNQNRLRTALHLSNVFVGRENSIRTVLRLILKGTKLNKTQFFLQIE